MLGRAVVRLPPAKQRPVAVPDELGLLVFLDDLVGHVEVGDHPQPAGVADLQPEVVVERLALRHVALLHPRLVRIPPEALVHTDPIDRLAPLETGNYVVK